MKFIIKNIGKDIWNIMKCYKKCALIVNLILLKISLMVQILSNHIYRIMRKTFGVMQCYEIESFDYCAS